MYAFILSFFLFGPSEGAQALQDVNQAAGDVVAVRKNPHLQSAVCSAGEDAVVGLRLHLHDAGTNVAEDGLLGVLAAERVHEPMTC